MYLSLSILFSPTLLSHGCNYFLSCRLGMTPFSIRRNKRNSSWLFRCLSKVTLMLIYLLCSYNISYETKTWGSRICSTRHYYLLKKKKKVSMWYYHSDRLKWQWKDLKSLDLDKNFIYNKFYCRKFEKRKVW